jgi:hypothetical protein
MEPPANDPIRDYIRANRDRYTKEAIRDQLLAAGHDQSAIDAAWQQVAAEEPPAAAQGKNLALYVWILYWLGGAVIATITLLALLGSTGGSGFTAFGVAWLVAYLALTFFPARAMARARPTGGIGLLGLIVLAPLVVVLIGGGICLGTIALILGALGT